jgi:hypothetical protein
MITYDELADALEDAWVFAGLHDHALVESITPDTFERSYRAELFPEHPEPLTDANSPPWVELAFEWNAAHQLAAEGRPIEPGAIEIDWTYTVDLRTHADRQDADLLRSFNAAVRNALRRTMNEQMPNPSEYIAVEIRRGYRTEGERLVLAYAQLVGTNVTDLSDLRRIRSPEGIAELLRDELVLVASVVRALAETFAPGSLGGYRSVDTA